jgi:hypothetical protein
MVACILPMGRRFSWVVFLILNSTASAREFYMAPGGSDRSGSGSIQSPWETLGHAIPQMQRGDTLIVRDGVYPSQACSGLVTPGAPITVRAENDYRAVLRSTANSHRVLSVYGTQGVTFQGMRFEATPDAPTSGSSEYLVHVSSSGTVGSRNVGFLNCIFGDSYFQDTIKVNTPETRDVWFRGCVFFNNAEGCNIFDINTVTDVDIEECIFFQDYAGSGRTMSDINGGAAGMILIKNSGKVRTSERFRIRRNVFFSYQGSSDYGFIQLGEDDKDFYEVTDCLIENNLFISNQGSRILGVLCIKDSRQITYRANTEIGHMNVGSFGVAGFFQKQKGTVNNPGNDDLRFYNNIWADNTGTMVKFSAGYREESTHVQTSNNVYWNRGNRIPNNDRVLEANQDARRILKDPQLPDPPADIAYPRWNDTDRRFPSGNVTIRQEFERLVKTYAALGQGSAAIDAADPTNMPAEDILGNRRDDRPDCGCLEMGARK